MPHPKPRNPARLPRLVAALSAAALISAACTPAAVPSPTPVDAAARTPTAGAAPTTSPTASEPAPAEGTGEPAPPTAAGLLPEGAGAPGIGDSYYPHMGNGGYDVQHYTLDLTVDLEGQTIDGTATIKAQATDDLTRFNLDFYGFNIASLTVDGQPARFERQEGELIVMPAAALSAGDAFTVVVCYSGAPGAGVDPAAPLFSQGWHFYEDGVMVAGEPTGASSWYPVNEHPSDKASYTFRVTVAKPHVVAANGVLAETVDSGSTRTYVWEMDDPMASYLTTLAVGDFVEQAETTPGGVRVRNYFDDDLPGDIVALFSSLPPILDYYQSVFGPYPFDAAGVVVHDLDLHFALETQSLVVFGRQFVSDLVISHELAHMWFGDSVTIARWRDIWLNEGFTTYASILWIEHSQGQPAAEREIRGMYENMVRLSALRLQPSELGQIVNELPMQGIVLTPSQAEAALAALLGSSLSGDEVAALVARAPEDEIDRTALVALIYLLEEPVTVTRSGFESFLRAVGLGLLANNIAAPILLGDPGPDNLFSGLVYQRGALTLHALRLRVGDETFFDILRTYYDRFKYSNATTEDFIALAGEMSGQDLGPFFQAWLFEEQMPDIPEMGLFQEDVTPAS